MIVRTFLHRDPVAISYLLGCAGHAAAAVVDPIGDVRPYLSAAEETGMRIRYVIDTHLHADHLSAGRALAATAGGEYVLFAEAQADYPFRGVRDGERLTLGNVTIDVLQYTKIQIWGVILRTGSTICCMESLPAFLLSRVSRADPFREGVLGGFTWLFALRSYALPTLAPSFA
jgi:hypothetical protein